MTFIHTMSIDITAMISITLIFIATFGAIAIEAIVTGTLKLNSYYLKSVYCFPFEES